MRQPLHLPGKLRDLEPCPPHDGQDLQGRDDPIPGGRVLSKDEVPGLLSPEQVIGSPHLFHDVTIPNRGPNELSSHLFQGKLQTDVAHDRGHNRVVRQVARTNHLPPAEGHHSIPVHDPALFVRKDDAVSVAVQGDPDIRTGLFRQRGHPLRVLGTARLVDVLAVRLHPQGPHLGAQLREHRGCNPIARTIGTVEHDVHALEGELLGKGLLRKNDVPSPRIVDPKGLAHLVGRRLELGETIGDDQPLHLLLVLIRQLVSVPMEELDPVVLKKVVGRRDHHARIRPHALCDERNPGGRKGPDHECIHAHRTDSRDHRVLEHIAGKAGILAHHNPVTACVCTAQVGDGPTEPQGNIGRHGLLVCYPTHPIRSKKPSHLSPPFPRARARKLHIAHRHLSNPPPTRNPWAGEPSPPLAQDCFSPEFHPRAAVFSPEGSRGGDLLWGGRPMPQSGRAGANRSCRPVPRG